MAISSQGSVLGPYTSSGASLTIPASADQAVISISYDNNPAVRPTSVTLDGQAATERAFSEDTGAEDVSVFTVSGFTTGASKTLNWTLTSPGDGPVVYVRFYSGAELSTFRDMGSAFNASELSTASDTAITQSGDMVVIGGASFNAAITLTGELADSSNNSTFGAIGEVAATGTSVLCESTGNYPSVAFVVLQPTTGNDVDANTDTFTLSEQQASVSADTEVSASTAAFTLTEHIVALGNDTVISAAVEANTLTPLTAQVGLDTEVVSGGADAHTLDETPAFITTADDIWTGLVAEDYASLPADTVFPSVSSQNDQYMVEELSGDVFFVTDYGVVALNSAPSSVRVWIYDESAEAMTAPVQWDLSGDAGISGNVAAFTLSEFTAAIGTPIEVDANTDTFTTTEYQSTVDVENTVQTSSDSHSLTEWQATISGSLFVAANVDANTLTEHQADVQLGPDVNTVTETNTLTTYAASLTYDRNVFALTTAYTLSERRASLVEASDLEHNNPLIEFNNVDLYHKDQSKRMNRTTMKHKA